MVLHQQDIINSNSQFINTADLGAVYLNNTDFKFFHWLYKDNQDISSIGIDQIKQNLDIVYEQ
jgi:hypothetical protein